jgi:hypothetical protein
MRTFEVTRGWKYEGYEGGEEDSTILVDGQQIGGAYRASYVSGMWGGVDGPITGDRPNWASWGPRGLSFGHRTREDAEQAQVREYVTNPDLYDRLIREDSEQRAAEQAEREARRAAEREAWEAEDRRQRLGDDEPGPTILTIPAYHALYASLAETDAVTAWLAAHGISPSAVHDIRVEQRATRRVVVFEASRYGLSARGTKTETYVVTLTAEPPEITSTPPADAEALFADHWPAKAPLHDFGQGVWCAHCRAGQVDGEFDRYPWPCPTVEAAIALTEVDSATA